jgi:environmental stress-induced protein Ves
LDEEAPESPAWEQPREPGQHRSICRLERRSLDLASEDRHFVAQHHDFNGEIRFFANDETDQLKDAAERPVEEREGHVWMLTAPSTSRQSPAHS